MKKVIDILAAPGRHWVGNGFPVHGMFDYNGPRVPLRSPFLLLDYAAPTRFGPTTERRGVGQHPHRGFETVTIVYAGEVEHRDSTGQGGIIGPGDVQWMTAAGGILHEEFHAPAYAAKGGPFEMVQLWVNLPAKDKLTAPRYQDIGPERIPVVQPADGVIVKVIAGEFGGATGPVAGIVTAPVYLDIALEPGAQVEIPLPEGHHAFAYVFDGTDAQVAGEKLARSELAVLSPGGSVRLGGRESAARVLLVAGKPLGESVARYGPFVMNTPEEIQQAFADFRAGKF